MRITVVQDYLRRGGTERQSLLLCREFRKLGATPSLISFRPGGPLSGEVAEAGIEHRALLQFDTGLNFLAPGLGAAVTRSEPDAVLCMGRMANAFAGYLQRRRPDTAVVGTVRTGKQLPWYNWRSFRGLPLIISNTDWWRRELEKRGLARGNLAVVPNGLSFGWRRADLQRMRTDVRARLGLEPEEPLLLNVAGFRPGKRHEHLIHLLAQLPRETPWRAALVGDGDRLSHARRLTSDLELNHRITLPGSVDDPAPYYAAADIAVSVSLEDALPNFLVEAQVAGLPVVATDYQGVREAFLPEESGYLVAPDDEAGFLSHVRTLISQPAAREAMGGRGSQWATERFDPARCARRHLELLQQQHAAMAAGQTRRQAGRP